LEVSKMEVDEKTKRAINGLRRALGVDADPDFSGDRVRKALEGLRRAAEKSKQLFPRRHPSCVWGTK